ncbi:MAG: hypothetical protein V1813_01520 [Candidatus Aenigmatarchaeota archaeon]
MAWNSHHPKKKHMHEVMSKRELAAGSVLVAAVLIVIVMTSHGSLVLQGSPSGGLPQMRAKISFDRYINDYLYYGDREVALQGFLRSRTVAAPGAGMGVYEYYIVDDYGKEIHLIDLGVLQRSLFSTDATTVDLYNVTGIIKTRYAGFDLRVESIEKSS